VIGLVGFTRFPIFYSSNGRKILGCLCADKEFEKYVYSLRRASIAIKTLRDIRLRSRFVVNHNAINPHLKMREIVPPFMYVYPDEEPDETLNSAYTLGFILKGARCPVYIPLICLRLLTEKEVQALLVAAVVKPFRESPLERFLEELGIRHEKHKTLADGRLVLRIEDPQVNQPYMVVIDRQWKVHAVNFCIDMHHDFYLPELIMLTRDRKDLYIFSEFEYE